MTSHLLHIEGLGIDFARSRVLHDIHLQLPRGEFVALLGPNASGKTTLLHALAGMLTPSAGRILIDGHDVQRDPLAARQALGFAIDPARLPTALSGLECLQLFTAARGLPHVPEATMALAEALALHSALPHRVARYSLGTRQKLGIVLGLIGEPPLLVLDEPLNGLDPRSARVLKQVLQQRTREGATVLLATHALDVAERFVSQALLLVEGRLRHRWEREALDAIRDDPERSLEQAMVAVLEASDAHGREAACATEAAGTARE